MQEESIQIEETDKIYEASTRELYWKKNKETGMARADRISQ